ncbi:MAG: hypothetical protein OEW68_15060 [Gammaproteobacteria bacterium]|nr:hypothetical protein [Gammaproteobacteria bacterium]MDH4316146.1 hypothetical protein [Gammaproteobacteria bacterium]MDH5215344.1 hypothetical protein [Gammaproteobacteria bacterium]
MAVAGFGWVLTMALSFELARITRTFEYRGFLQALPGSPSKSCSSARDIRTRGESVASGFTAGFVGGFPAVVFHLTFMSAYPASLEQPLPTYWMIGQLARPWLMIVFIVVLFAMIIQTCAGRLQGFNERLDAWLLERRGRKGDPMAHAIVSDSALLISLFLASFGITALVAKGYGNLAWGYLLVYFIPLLTIGVYKILKKAGKTRSLPISEWLFSWPR